MPDIQSDPFAPPDMTSVTLSPAQKAAWIQRQQARLDAGLPLDKSGIPPGYKVDNGKIVEQNAWDIWGKGAAIGMGAGIAGGFGAGYLNDIVNGASSIADLGAVSGAEFGSGASASVMPAGTAVGAGTGAATVADLGAVSPSAFGGASATVFPAGTAVGTLPSSTIGTGMISAAPSSVSSMTAAPGASAGLTDWLKRAQDVGDSLSAMSAGRAEGRAAEGIANQNQNRAAVDLYNAELEAPAKIARNSVRGDILGNAQDVHIDHPSTIPDFTISGGLRPSMFSDATRQTGRNISSAAARTPIPTPTAPILPPLPQANGFDDTLNIASTISGLSRAVPPSWWGAIGKGLKGLFT